MVCTSNADTNKAIRQPQEASDGKPHPARLQLKDTYVRRTTPLEGPAVPPSVQITGGRFTNVEVGEGYVEAFTLRRATHDAKIDRRGRRDLGQVRGFPAVVMLVEKLDTDRFP